MRVLLTPSRELILVGDLIPSKALTWRGGASLRSKADSELGNIECPRGASVSFDEVAATYIMRRLVESYAMRRAMFNLSRRDLSEAERLAEQAAAATDPQMARDLNRAFHFFFYERCGLPSLTNRIDAMWRAFLWDLTLTTKDRAEASFLEHRELLQALRQGDEEAVARATEEHIAHGFQSIAHHLDGTSKGDPFDFSLP